MLEKQESLALAMAALVEAEETLINTALPDGVDDLVIYPWRPREKPDLPALWHFPSTDSDSRQRDTASREDMFRLSAYIGVEPQMPDEAMADFEIYADVFREVMDPEFDGSKPLGGTVITASRLNMRPVLDTFGVIDVICIEFPLELRLARVHPTPS
jgi:hypothetical protein